MSGIPCYLLHSTSKLLPFKAFTTLILAPQVTALDFAEEMLDYAETRQRAARSNDAAEIDWVLGDATDLPFENATFDAATMGYGLRNVGAACILLSHSLQSL